MRHDSFEVLWFQAGQEPQRLHSGAVRRLQYLQEGHASDLYGCGFLFACNPAEALHDFALRIVEAISGPGLIHHRRQEFHSVRRNHGKCLDCSTVSGLNSLKKGHAEKPQRRSLVAPSRYPAKVRYDDGLKLTEPVPNPGFGHEHAERHLIKRREMHQFLHGLLLGFINAVRDPRQRCDRRGQGRFVPLQPTDV